MKNGPSLSHELKSTLPIQPAEQVLTSPREAALRKLLPYDYDYANNSGLIDMFYYDPENGHDGLLHTLVGDVTASELGSTIPGGFHHEPSAAELKPLAAEPAFSGVAGTRVERDHLDTLSTRNRRRFEEVPFEPYLGQVVIGGLRKMAVHTNRTTGERSLTPAKNSMYPKEYDPLAVMQAIRIARESRDRTKDVYSTTAEGMPVIVNVGTAPLIDGETPMSIRLVLDAQEERVVTAIPQIPEKPGIMRLTEEQIQHHVYGK